MINANLIAKSPPAILLAIGGIGWLAGMNGSGIFILSGIGLQVLWLIK
jgi:hypothetical protein